jgi:hypothetical protein
MDFVITTYSQINDEVSFQYDVTSDDDLEALWKAKQLTHSQVVERFELELEYPDDERIGFIQQV